MQALHLQGLEPIAETLADPNSYGFRPKRSTADAIGQCFNALCGTGASKEVLETRIKPAVVYFLKERGLELSEEKTRITHIEDGFDSLGFNVRKYSGKMLVKPSRAAIKRFLDNIRELIKNSVPVKTEQLIRQLNSKIRGWANYYRHVVAKRTFTHVDARVFRALWTWIKRRHPHKSAQWKKARYFRHIGLRQMVFFAKVQDKVEQLTCLDLFQAGSAPIVRHVKVQAAATPYDPAYSDYFANRACRRQVRSGAAN